MPILIRLAALLVLVAAPSYAQNGNAASTNRLVEIPAGLPGKVQSPTNQNPPGAQSVGDLRAACIENRRTICGKVLKLLPEGLVVDSGYTNLMRPPLNFSWVAPGTVASQRATNLVEASQPGSVCVGLVFLTNVPKKPVPKLYDYVNLVGYPSGQFTYTSVGEVRRTVRKFSAKLSNAVQWKLDALEQQNPPLK